jgi:hypothetical protein
MALDSWTVHETDSGKKDRRLFGVTIDTKNRQGHCYYYGCLWCVWVPVVLVLLELQIIYN